MKINEAFQALMEILRPLLAEGFTIEEIRFEVLALTKGDM